MTVIPSIVNLFTSNRIKQIEHFKRNPAEIQEKAILSLIAISSKTEWGERYRYRSMSSVKDFQNVVPVQNYEDLIPYVDRLKMGEHNLLWPGEIKWFAKSSGTTSTKSKFIPISSEALEQCHYRGARDTLALYSVQKSDTGIFTGKGLTLGGSKRTESHNSTCVFGDLSAILIDNAPPWIEIIRTPKTSIALIEDFEDKLEKIAKTTLSENVTNLSGVPSWCMVMIKYLLQYTGKRNLLEIWPNFEVFFHGGINFTPYREQYRQLLPSDKVNYMELYNASEGFFGIQDDLTSSDMLLMLDYGVFYEFIESDKVLSDTPKVLTIGEVEKGVNYAIIISTNGGLWRYMIGDTIVFTSLFPHKFRITGRTKHFINAFGEEVIIDNAEKAIDKACKVTGAIISEYTAGPVYMGTSTKGSHEWIIEFEKEPDSIQLFTETLDKTLQSVNSDYEAKRHKNITLDPPLIRSVPKGTFYEWLKGKNKLGGQYKVPRLANNREFIEEVLKIVGKIKA
jgi:hypothetical protein